VTRAASASAPAAPTQRRRPGVRLVSRARRALAVSMRGQRRRHPRVVAPFHERGSPMLDWRSVSAAGGQERATRPASARGEPASATALTMVQSGRAAVQWRGPVLDPPHTTRRYTPLFPALRLRGREVG